ncbi:hypothetical protein AAFF_G00226940 [Aldrovandia affinis]|uniref:Secreted protein n=1 Tax=Aldrovandia affinis TaxID=143900 RepID=A0AAD7X1N2_9TELE|nr:hypothetical protein AAFF_G00226940 [Aldrovandia affinis]
MTSPAGGSGAWRFTALCVVWCGVLARSPLLHVALPAAWRTRRVSRSADDGTETALRTPPWGFLCAPALLQRCGPGRSSTTTRPSLPGLPAQCTLRIHSVQRDPAHGVFTHPPTERPYRATHCRV